jgi:purine nucleoside phosphorylase
MPIDFRLDLVNDMTNLLEHAIGLVLGVRFPPMGHAYDRHYQMSMRDVAKTNRIVLQEGVYCALGE